MKRLLWISVLLALSTSLCAQQKLYGVTREGGLYGGGTLFSADTTGANYNVLHNFNRPEHSPDNNEVIEGTDGYLYGTISSGSMYDAGALVRMKKDGTGYAVLYSFDGTNAKRPSGHMALSGGYLYGTTSGGGDDNVGIIFKVKTDGTDYQVLHDFTTESGNTPQSGVILGADGGLYGVTQEGGSAQQGTLYTIKTDGTGFAVLHNFDVTEGALPYGGLFQASDNALYGMAATRDATSRGFLYSINTDGSNYRSLYTFTTGANPHGTLTQLGDGYLYGITSTFIFRIKTDGTDFNTMRTFDGATGLTGIGKLVLAPNGYLYGVTAEGGILNEGVVFRIKPDGTAYNSLSEFTVGQNPTGNILLSGTGLYGMTSDGGDGFSGVIYKFETTSSVLSNLHNFYESDPNGETPIHLVAGPDNTLYGVTDQGGNEDFGLIFKINQDGSGYSVLYNFTLRSEDGASPNGLFYASNGYLYGTTAVGGDWDKGTLFRLKPDGSAFETIHEWLGSDGAHPTGGMAEWNNEIWIMTEEGGANDAGTIHAIPLTNTDLRGVYDFDPSAGAGKHPTGRLLAATDGNLYGLTQLGGQNDKGTFFRLTSSDGTPETLFNFSILQGYLPAGSLVETPDGYLNGISTTGALNGAGELFKIKPDGTDYRTISPFYDPPATDAVDQVIVSSTGKLYGVTVIGELNVGYGAMYATKINGADLSYIYNFDFVTGSTPMAITLGGAGTSPELDVTIDDVATTNPGKKDFGTISVLTSSADATVTLKNTGAANLVLKGNPKVSITGSTADFTINQTTLPATIEPGKSGSFSVTFKPQTSGSKTATLLISSNDTDEGSFTINLTGSAIKQGQTITFNTLAAKTYGDADFTLQGSSTANLPVTFTSANPDIASISGSTVTIKKAGSVDITASQAGNDNVSAATPVKRTLVINKATQTITFNTPAAQTYGAADFTLQASSSSNLAVTFTSGNPDIASISGNTVTIKKAGSVDITVSQTGNDNISAAAVVKRTLVINKATQSIQFATLSNKKAGDAPFTLSATVTSNLPITYTSSNKAVATISGNTVTIVGVGQTNITASQPGNDNYQAAPTVQQPLTVSDKAIAMQLTPASLDFGDVVLGESADKSFTINNTGEGTLEVSAITLPEGFTTSTGSGTIALTAGTGITVTITFAPTNAAAYTGTINIQSNATTDQHTVAVTGKGVPVTAISDPSIPAPNIYPNPGAGVYTITTTQLLTPQNTQLLSAQGAVVNAALQHTQPDVYQLDLTTSPAGIYLLLIQRGTDTSPQTYRIIKQ